MSIFLGKVSLAREKSLVSACTPIPRRVGERHGIVRYFRAQEVPRSSVRSEIRSNSHKNGHRFGYESFRLHFQSDCEFGGRCSSTGVEVKLSLNGSEQAESFQALKGTYRPSGLDILLMSRSSMSREPRDNWRPSLEFQSREEGLPASGAG